MPYLTRAEYEEYADEIDDATFDKLLKRASALLDVVTNHYYVKNDIATDNAWRVNQFKKALCSQIEYFIQVGATSFEGVNKAPQSFSAGRTSVSNASRFNPGGENESKSLVAEEVFIFLEGTGLLYAGVSVL